MKALDIVPLNQRAREWRDIRIGTCSGLTIGTSGCLITCFSMLASVIPPAMNQRMIDGGYYWRGCNAATFNVAGMGYPNAPQLIGVTGTYQAIAFPASEMSRVWLHCRAGWPAAICVDHDPTTDKFEQHWVLAVGAFGTDPYRDFIIDDPWDGVQPSMQARYGNLARAMVRAALYGDPDNTRLAVGTTDSRQGTKAFRQE